MKKKYLILFLCGALSFFSHAPLHIFPIFILSYGALLFFFTHYGATLKTSFLMGQCFGFGYFLGGLYWVGNSLLVDPSQFLIFTPIAYLGFPFLMGTFYGLALMVSFLLYGVLQKSSVFFVQNHKIIKWLLLASILSIMDILRGSIFTGFPWNLPVYALGGVSILMQPAYYLGSYVYNSLFIFWLLSFGIYMKWPMRKSIFEICRNNKKIIFMQFFCLMVVSLVGFLRIYNFQKPIMDNEYIYRLVQPNISQSVRWDPVYLKKNYDKTLSLTTKDLNPDKKYIFIWPETSLHYHPEFNEKIATELNEMLDNKHYLIAGKLRYVQKSEGNIYDIYNSLYSVSSNGEVISQYDKIHLVPFGEYLPLEGWLKKLGLRHISHFQNSFKFGKKQTIFTVGNDLRLGALICYEAIFPEYARQLQRKNIDMIVNITNDAWFGFSSGPYQHLVQTQFRAVENNVPIIRSANTGISAIIDPLGRVTHSLGLNSAGYIDYKF